MGPKKEDWEALLADVALIKEALLGQVDSETPGLLERLRTAERHLAALIKVGGTVVLLLLGKVLSDVLGFPIKF